MIKKKHKNITLINLTQFNDKLIYLHNLNGTRRLLSNLQFCSFLYDNWILSY